jgi:hypothetical protein
VRAACSLGGAGHLGPLRPFLDAARRANHATVVVAPPAMAAIVETAGHPFLPGGEPAEADILTVSRVFDPDQLGPVPARHEGASMVGYQSGGLGHRHRGRPFSR